jgi:hypothetical protein
MHGEPNIGEAMYSRPLLTKGAVTVDAAQVPACVTAFWPFVGLQLLEQT